jgi:hypothetical protein
MARPRRPEAEAQAVREAAEIVRAETGLTSARAISREVARRVSLVFMADLEADPLDQAFAAIDRATTSSPFQRLASCPDINIASEFVKLRLKAVEARQGRYLSPQHQEVELRQIAENLRNILTGRYDWQLRNA